MTNLTSRCSPPPRLLLFDIDGTLMLSGGAGRRALERCFLELFSIPDALEGLRLHGLTDPHIIRDALLRAGRSPDLSPDEMQGLYDRYFAYLAPEMERSDRAALMPGVIPLLDELAGRPGVHLGLVTGNVEPAARIKLSRFDLNRYFQFGAFASDSAIRDELVPIAIDRARARHGVSYAAGDVIVIGDTERDIACGRIAGARTLAVATGGCSIDVLRQAGPDHLFHDLASTGSILSILLGSLE